jgi:ABC-type uncharacterized transport system permease subunit
MGIDFSQILSISFLVALLSSGIRMAIPVFITALGELINESAGGQNYGIEGVMLIGALSAFLSTKYLEAQTGAIVSLAPWVGVICAILVGALASGVYAIVAIRLRADYTITGISLGILCTGIVLYISRLQPELFVARVKAFSVTPLPLLSKIPIIGDLLFSKDVMTYLSGVILLGGWILLYRTTWGLAIRSAGMKPEAADTSGINVPRIRSVAAILGGALAGLGGAVLVLSQTHTFSENITAGRGWLAIALVIFAQWRPELAFVGSLLFGIATALQLRIQALNIEVIPYEFLVMLPYVLTILVLLRKVKKTVEPTAMGEHYIRE